MDAAAPRKRALSLIVDLGPRLDLANQGEKRGLAATDAELLCHRRVPAAARRREDGGARTRALPRQGKSSKPTRSSSSPLSPSPPASPVLVTRRPPLLPEPPPPPQSSATAGPYKTLHSQCDLHTRKRKLAIHFSSSEHLASLPHSCSSDSNGGQGGGCPPGCEQVLGAPAHRHGGAGVRGQGLQGAPSGPAVRARRAQVVVLLPRRHRRVHGHLPLPLRDHPHRDGRQQLPLQVRHRRHPGHRLVLRRHDLRARLLHRRHLRRSHQPGGDLRPVPGEEAVADEGGVLHRDAVPGRHLRRRRGQGVPAEPVHEQRRRRQRRRARLHQGRRPRRRDRRHLRPRLHRLLRHRRQEERQGLPRPDPCPAAHRVRRVPGPPGHHPHHRHRHQPGQEPRRRPHLQQGARLVRPLDLLGRPLHRRRAGGHLPPGGHQGHPVQEQVLS